GLFSHHLRILPPRWHRLGSARPTAGPSGLACAGAADFRILDSADALAARAGISDQTLQCRATAGGAPRVAPESPTRRRDTRAAFRRVMITSKRILVIEADQLTGEWLNTLLGAEAFRVSMADSVKEGLELLSATADFAAIICDYCLPDGTCQDLLNE